MLNEDGVSHEDFLRYGLAVGTVTYSPPSSISRAFQKFGGFTSGIGIHYAQSTIVNATHQSCAKNLIIGQRMPPQILLRAADSRPFELQDLLPADNRFKVLVFTGDTSRVVQLSKVARLAQEMTSTHGFLQRCSSAEKTSTAFDIITISSASRSNVRHNDLPELFRSHWSKFVFLAHLSPLFGTKPA